MKNQSNNTIMHQSNSTSSLSHIHQSTIDPPPPPPPYVLRDTSPNQMYPHCTNVGSNISLYRGVTSPYYTSNTSILGNNSPHNKNCIPQQKGIHPSQLNFNLLLQKPFYNNNNELTASTLPLRKSYDQQQQIGGNNYLQKKYRVMDEQSISPTYHLTNEFSPSPPTRRCHDPAGSTFASPSRCHEQSAELIRYYSYTLPRLRQYYNSPDKKHMNPRHIRPKSYYFYDNVQAFDAEMLRQQHADPKMYHPIMPNQYFHPHVNAGGMSNISPSSHSSLRGSNDHMINNSPRPPQNNIDSSKMYPILPNLSVMRHFPIPEYSKTYIQNSQSNIPE